MVQGHADLVSFRFKNSRHLVDLREGVEGLGQVPQTLGGRGMGETDTLWGSAPGLP